MQETWICDLTGSCQETSEGWSGGRGESRDVRRHHATVANYREKTATDGQAVDRHEGKFPAVFTRKNQEWQNKREGKKRKKQSSHRLQEVDGFTFSELRLKPRAGEQEKTRRQREKWRPQQRSSHTGMRSVRLAFWVKVRKAVGPNPALQQLFSSFLMASSSGEIKVFLTFLRTA